MCYHHQSTHTKCVKNGPWHLSLALDAGAGHKYKAFEPWGARCNQVVGAIQVCWTWSIVAVPPEATAAKTRCSLSALQQQHHLQVQANALQAIMGTGTVVHCTPQQQQDRQWQQYACAPVGGEGCCAGTAAHSMNARKRPWQRRWVAQVSTHHLLQAAAAAAAAAANDEKGVTPG
jgi:hypothetical protein